MNLADSGSLATILKGSGYIPVSSENDADLIILNTCSVRERAEERVFGRLGELSGLKKGDRNRRIAVVGCMAQRLGNRILERAPYVDLILGPDRLLDLPRYLNNGATAPAVHTEFGYARFEDITPERDNPYAAYVTVMRGCSQYCTYCIVPYVRGGERSYPAEKIIGQIKALVSDGVVEVTLLGQNVNAYRHENCNFADLLKKIAGETAIRRIRFMTSHPKDLSDQLIETMAGEAGVMAHLHLPLQSGSDRVLEKMNRRYTYAHYRDLVGKLRAAIGDIALTTDLIVGFPSESEAEYEMTLAAVEEIGFDSAFMFRYSSREGTAAAGFADDVSEEDKIRRLTRLINLQKDISFKRNQAEPGKIRSVLVDGFSRRDRRLLKGKTEGNKTILFEGNEALIGTIQNIRVVSADSWTLHGEATE